MTVPIPQRPYQQLHRRRPSQMKVERGKTCETDETYADHRVQVVKKLGPHIGARALADAEERRAGQ